MSKGTGGQDAGPGADRVEASGSRATQPLSPQMPAITTAWLIGVYHTMVLRAIVGEDKQPLTGRVHCRQD